jgi:hypothetical protein
MRVLGFELLRLVPAASQAPAADGRSSCGPMQEGCPRLRTGNRIRSRQPKCPDSNVTATAASAPRQQLGPVRSDAAAARALPSKPGAIACPEPRGIR